MRDFNEWNEIYDLLKAEEAVEVGPWCFCGRSITCHTGCCDNVYNTIHDTLEWIKFYADGDIENVKKISHEEF